MNKREFPKSITHYETTDFSGLSNDGLLAYYKKVSVILENPVKRDNVKDKFHTYLSGFITLDVIMRELISRGCDITLEFDSITHTSLKVD